MRHLKLFLFSDVGNKVSIPDTDTDTDEDKYYPMGSILTLAIPVKVRIPILGHCKHHIRLQPIFQNDFIESRFESVLSIDLHVLKK